jgi:hypothetical protein
MSCDRPLDDVGQYYPYTKIKIYRVSFDEMKLYNVYGSEWNTGGTE